MRSLNVVSAALTAYVVGASIMGCAMGGGPNVDGSSIDGSSGIDAGREDAEVSACDPACEGTEICEGGVCVEPTTDCEEGAAPRMIACARCGLQRQTCVAGTWVDDGACSDQGECVAGAMEDGAACACGIQRRRCGTDCAWEPFECTGAGECAPSDTETMPGVSCGDCGTMTQTRTCNAGTCMWNAWQDGTCSGEGVCTPDETRGGCDLNSAGAATACGIETCTSSCTWGACETAPSAACLRQGGTAYQCCTPPGGGSGWQYCNSSCQWFACEAHACSTP